MDNDVWQGMLNEGEEWVEPHPRRPDPTWSSRKKHAANSREWRMIEGAVVDACVSHPEYLTEAGRRGIVGSVTKRVLGVLVSAGLLPAGGRRKAADEGDRALTP